MLKKIFDLVEQNMKKLILNWHYPENDDDLRDLIESISEKYISSDIRINPKKIP